MRDSAEAQSLGSAVRFQSRSIAMIGTGTSSSQAESGFFRQQQCSEDPEGPGRRCDKSLRFFWRPELARPPTALTSRMGKLRQLSISGRDI